jgi:membrane protein YdbS with pleckstrin-like domain
MVRAKVRFGLLIGAIALLVFLILFQQALHDGLITSFVGAVFVTTITAVFLLGIAQFLRWEYEDYKFEPTADGVGARGVRSGHTARNGARP